MHATLEDLYRAYNSGGCNLAERRFDEDIMNDIHIPDHDRRHVFIALTNWKDDLFHLISDEEKHILESYLVAFAKARKTRVADIQTEFFDCMQSGDINTFKRLYRSYACDMPNVKQEILERCLRSGIDDILDYYVTERFESMSNLLKYFTADTLDTDIINVIAKSHKWKKEYANDERVTHILKNAIRKHRHLLVGKDAPEYIQEYIKQSYH